MSQLTTKSREDSSSSPAGLLVSDLLQRLVRGGERLSEEAGTRITISTYLSAQGNGFLNRLELFTCVLRVCANRLLIIVWLRVSIGRNGFNPSYILERQFIYKITNWHLGK